VNKECPYFIFYIEKPENGRRRYVSIIDGKNTHCGYYFSAKANFSYSDIYIEVGKFYGVSPKNCSLPEVAVSVG
jgi:hypothetical protein